MTHTKIQKYAMIALTFLVIVLIVYAVDLKPRGNVDLQSRYNITDAVAYCDGATCYSLAELRSNGSASNMTWTGLYSYPAGCPSGYAITALGDTVTCSIIESSIDHNMRWIQADNGTDLVNMNDLYNNTVLMLPEGTYNISSTINLDSDNWIVGTGKTIIRPTGNITMFNMTDTFIKVRDLTIYTTNVAGFGGTVFLFTDSPNSTYDQRGGWNYIENVYIEGTVNESTGSKAIYLIDDDGEGVTWANMEGIHIKNFDYGVYLDCDASGGYVNANRFENIHLTSTIKGITLDGTSDCPVNGNTFTAFANINTYFMYGVWLDRAQYNRFDNLFYDANSIACTYNISVNAHRNYVMDSTCSEAYISDLGTNNVWYLNDINIINKETDIEHRLLDSTYCYESISSGSITPSCNFIILDTEGDAATDNLSCISLDTQAVVYLQQENSARDITLEQDSCGTAQYDIFVTNKDGVQGSFTMASTSDVLQCVHSPMTSKGWRCIELY
jgi:hypothetical protein